MRGRPLAESRQPAGAGGGGRELRSREEERGCQEDEGAASDHVAVWIGNRTERTAPLIE